MTGEIKDLIYIAGVVVAVAGSHFMLRGRVMVLEDRTKRQDKDNERIFASLQRIEEKLDAKADK